MSAINTPPTCPSVAFQKPVYSTAAYSTSQYPNSAYPAYPAYSGYESSGYAPKAASTVAWIALILVIIAWFLIVIVFLVGWSKTTDIENNGISLQVQQGITSGQTDTLDNDTNVLYIANTSNTSLNLRVDASGSNSKGRSFFVKNNMVTGNVTLVGVGSVTFSGRAANGDNATTVSQNQLAWYVFTDTNQAFRVL